MINEKAKLLPKKYRNLIKLHILININENIPLKTNKTYNADIFKKISTLASIEKIANI